MSILTGTAYPISRPTGVCAATGRTLAVGDRCVAALVEQEDGRVMERQDFSVEAWDSGARPAAPRRLVGFWRTTVPAPDQKKTRFLSEDELIDLFEQMQDAAEPKRLAFRYVLALLLVRRRLLRHEGTKPAPDGRPMLVLSRRRAGAADGPVYEVVDPGLATDSVSAVVEQLSEIMAPEGASSPAPEPKT